MLKRYLIFEIMSYERPLRKVINSIKYESGGKVMTEFAALKLNAYSYPASDKDKNKKE